MCCCVDLVTLALIMNWRFILTGSQVSQVLKLPRGGIVEGSVRITVTSYSLLAGAPTIDHVIGSLGELKR